jgi:hypothetical protein
MKRKILSFLLGLFVSFFVTSIVQSLNYMIFDLPKNIDYSNEQEVIRLMQGLPVAAFWIVELSYFMGSFLGGLSYTWVSKSEDVGFPIGIAAFLTIAGILNLLKIPQPLWFGIVSTLTYFPTVFLGRFVALKNNQKES